MKQRVKTVSYLAKAEFSIKDGVYDLVALPTGAEVVKVSLELVGNNTSVTGSVTVGFKDIKDYFLNLQNVDNVNNKHATSAKDYTATSNNVIVAEVKKSVSMNDDVKGVLRVLYFLPSVIEVEY
ncbi:hypothetical protein ACLGEJ_04425 [Helicobacter pylori]